jgi:hypothetical protein
MGSDDSKDLKKVKQKNDSGRRLNMAQKVDCHKKPYLLAPKKGVKGKLRGKLPKIDVVPETNGSFNENSKLAPSSEAENSESSKKAVRPTKDPNTFNIDLKRWRQTPNPKAKPDPKNFIKSNQDIKIFFPKPLTPPTSLPKKPTHPLALAPAPPKPKITYTKKSRSIQKQGPLIDPILPFKNVQCWTINDHASPKSHTENDFPLFNEKYLKDYHESSGNQITARLGDKKFSSQDVCYHRLARTEYPMNEKWVDREKYPYSLVKKIIEKGLGRADRGFGGLAEEGTVARGRKYSFL